MIRGMPGEKQELVRSLPNPPASRSATLASAMAWYSGMSGAPWPRPTVLVGSNEAGPGASGMRVHCPRQSGYLLSSKAQAPFVVNSATARKVAPIKLRSSMTLPSFTVARMQRSGMRERRPGFRSPPSGLQFYTTLPPDLMRPQLDLELADRSRAQAYDVTG